MAFRFPFSNLHELNLDWILAQVKRFSELIPSMEEAEDSVEEAITTAEQANTTAEQANATAEQANATAEEAKEIAEQATGGAFPSDNNPLMDGTASAGTENTYSRSDHVHPSDSSKADVSALATKANVSDLATKADASALNNYVLKAGDTMSGNLSIIKNGQPIIKLQNLVNTTTTRASSLFFNDASDNSLAYLEGVIGANNDRNIFTGVLKNSINNYLQLSIDVNDGCSVVVSHPQAWRRALGIEDTITLLWTNSSPSSSFNAQTISLDLSTYDAVIIDTGIASDDDTGKSFFCFVGRSYYLDLFPLIATGRYGRSANITQTGVVFSQGYYNTSINDTCVIPLKIYGIKG